MTRTAVLAACFVSLVLVQVSPLVAQQAPTQPSELDEMTEEELIKELIALSEIPIVSASKSEQTVANAPAKIVVVTAEEIKTRGYMGIDEIFHDLAGVDINKGRGVEWTTLFMRGMRTENTDRFLLIWDGVIQNDTWKYNVWVSRQYPLSNVERIEFMYGPSSLLYGANAFAGIINVILKKPKDVDGFSIMASGGSYGSALGEFNYGRESGNWRFMANGRWFESDEMDMNGESWIDNAGRRRYHNWILDRDGRRDASQPSGYAAGLKVTQGIPYQSYDGVDRPFDGTAYGDTKDWFIQAGVGYKGFDLKVFSWYRQEIEDNWYVPLRRMHGPWTPEGSAIYLNHDVWLTTKMSLKSYLRQVTAGLDDKQSYDGAFTRNINNNINDPNNLTTSSLGTVTWYALFNREYRAGQQLNYSDGPVDVTGGWEYVSSTNYEDYNIRTRTDQPWNYTPQHDERNAAAFVNGQYTPNERFSVAGGLRYDYNYIDGEDGGFGDLVTGRLAGIYSPSNVHRFKLIYGEAFQAPSPWHKFATVAGERDLQNPSLKPESLESLEFIYELTPSPKWRTTASVYYNEVSDIIAAVAVPFQGGTTLQHQNTGGLEILGQELETRYYLDAKNSFWGNLTFSETKSDSGDDRQGDLAPFKANVGTDLLFRNKWGVSARAHYVDARDTINLNSPNIYAAKSVDSYFTVDTTLSWLNAWPGLDVRASVYNLFDEKYYDPGLRSGDGRTYNSMVIQEGIRGYVTVAYKF